MCERETVKRRETVVDTTANSRAVMHRYLGRLCTMKNAEMAIVNAEMEQTHQIPTATIEIPVKKRNETMKAAALQHTVFPSLLDEKSNHENALVMTLAPKTSPAKN